MDDIVEWLRQHGLEEHTDLFLEQQVRVSDLCLLTEDDIRELGLPMGPRKRLLAGIAALRGGPAASPGPGLAGPSGQTPFSEAERRQLTVMLCDLVGSTALSESMDPEDYRLVLGAYQSAAAGVIRRYDGYIARYMGDGLLVYFGFPRTHENVAERAVRAGLELAETVCRLKPRDDVDLQVRVGIATGMVVVGDVVGEGASEERVVLGETPNLAARLQALAEPGTVLISLSTQRLTGGLFEYADAGTHTLKGFSRPVRAWRVLSAAPDQSRFEAAQGVVPTPLVGRESEMALILERWDRVKEGEGQVVLLSSEPGLGKSRIVRGLQERLAGESYIPLSYYCSPFHSNTALHPVIGLLERLARIGRDDAPGSKLDKLEAMLEFSGGRLDDTVPLLATLLSIPFEDRYRRLSLTPQRQKQRTLEVLLEQVEGLAGCQPVLAIYEDVHWIDPTTLEALGLLIERAQRLPALVLITFRPDFEPPWAGYPHVSQLTLSRLTRSHSIRMIERITRGKALPDEVLGQLIAKTDGVPLFIEELTKAVLELGLLSDAGDRYELVNRLPSLEIPTSLHDSLMARLDRLAPVKEVAQIGAALGKEFSFELLAAVTPLTEERLRDALDQLVRAELLFRRHVSPGPVYSFRHALVQDAAYQSLLKAKRQQLHARIAGVLSEGLVRDGAASPELIAEHFARAGMHHDAARYWLEAGKRAKASYANAEALCHLEKCLSCMSPGGGAPAPAQTADERIGTTALALAGDLAGLAGDLDGANRRYDQALAQCGEDKLRVWIANKRHHAATIRRNGAKIAFYTHGSGEDTLLLVNPIVYGLAVFQPVLERLCQEFRIVTLDCRGTGDSDPLRRPFPLDEHAEDVAAVIAALDCASVTGIGISRGSNLLIKLAIAHPRLLRRLVTVGCPSVFSPDAGLPAFAPEYLRRRTAAYQRQDVAALLQIQSEFVYTEPGTEELKRLIMRGKEEMAAETVLSFYDPDPGIDISPLLGRVTIPTLVTHGTADRLVPFAAAERLAASLPNAQLYAFKDKGHLPMFTATDEFCEVVRNFVNMDPHRR